MDAKTAKRRFEEIGDLYSREVLLGYIAFFRENWIDRNSRHYETRLNHLRLLVYVRMAKMKGFYHEKR